MSQPMITTPIRKVVHLLGEYVVMEKVLDELGLETWSPVSRGYPHSTSAFAALGRIAQNDVKAQGLDG